VSGYVLTRAAETDIAVILDFIARDSARGALSVHAALEHALETIAARPLIGHLRRDIADETLRVWPVYSYLVIYRPETRPVQIVRVVHGARDLVALVTRPTRPRRRGRS